MDQSTQTMLTRRRPFGLYIIVTLQLTIAILLAMGFLILDVVDQELLLPIVNPLSFTASGWGIIVALVLASFGLLRLKRWGWTLTMILTGTGLALNIWNYFQGNANFLEMAIYIVIVFYLNQRDVQSPFTDIDSEQDGL